MVVNTMVDLLTAVLDLSSQTSIYTFATGTEFDQSYTLTGATVAVQGRDYGYDALGGNAAPVAARTTTWRFIHRYGVGESWTTVKDAMTIAFGHGRPILLQKTRPDGTVLIAEARLESFPDKATTDALVYADFTVTFTQREDWKAKDVSSPRYDTGLHYDTGALHYDQRGVLVSITGATTTFSLTNSGTVNERGALITFNGPIAGPFSMSNGSCDVRGMPFLPGVSGSVLDLVVNISLAAGEYLIIDSKTNQIVSNHGGIVPWAVVAKAPGQRFYWENVPGNNACSLTQNGSGTGGSVNFTARSRWRS